MACTDLLRLASLMIDIDGVLVEAVHRLSYIDIGVIGAKDVIAEQIIKLLSLRQIVKRCIHRLWALFLEQLLTLAQISCALCDQRAQAVLK